MANSKKSGEKIIHISRTSLAGAPIRIVNALNKYTKFDARLVHFGPAVTSQKENIFEEDLIWDTDRETSIELIKNADIIHFHHWFDLKFNPFLIDFTKECKNGCKFLRHFHSDKYFLNQTEIRFNENYEKDLLPKVVIPHCPERTFPELQILPNIMPIFDEEYLPKKSNNKRIKVLFSASQKRDMYEFRWATKGYEQVNKLLMELSENYDFDYEVISGLTFKQAMNKKNESDIIIGDIVTGSYHLTELEGLALGKPVFTWLDGRSVSTFMNTFKTKEVPFINANIYEIKDVLVELIQNRQLIDDIGAYSREWIEKYYQDEELIKNFVEVYDELLKTGSIRLRENFENNTTAKEFLNNRLYDIKWETRKKENEK